MMAAFATSLLGLAALSQVTAAPAAVASTGTFPVKGWFSDTDTYTTSGTYPTNATALRAPMVNLDNKLLMVSGNTSPTGSTGAGYIGYFVNDGTPPQNAIFTTIATLNGQTGTAGGTADNVSTLALDANVNKHGDGKPYVYAWSWQGLAGTGRFNTIMSQGGTLPSRNLDGTTGTNFHPIFRWTSGDTYPQISVVPEPRYFEATGLGGYGNRWSGGEVIQSTGTIFFSGGECSGLGGGYRMMTYDPNTGDYNYSGQIQPATTLDNIFGTADGCSGRGYVASDMALDALGNAYIIVTSNVPVPSLGDNSTNLTNWLVRVVPSTTGNWKYNLVQPLTVSPSEATGPSSARGWAGSIGPTPAPTASNLYMTYGMAFFKGALYAYTYSYPGIVNINPMSGTVKSVPPNSTTNQTPSPYAQDLASAETADIIQGTVYNDVNASGSVSGALGVGGVQVALYYLDPVTNKWTYEGSQITGSEGTYSILTGGQGTYAVRVVQPTIGAIDSTTGNYGQAGAVNAWQTYSSADYFPSLDGSPGGDTVTRWCDNTGSGTPVESTTSGSCAGQIPAPVVDPATPGLAQAGINTTLDFSQMPMVSKVVIASDVAVATADFGITASGSFGDAVAGPPAGPAATVAPTGDTPAHINGLKTGTDYPVYLGTTLGTYAGPAADGKSHDTTDDGLYIGSASTAQGKVNINTAMVLAGGRSYTLNADVSGTKAGSALVNAWTTGVGNNTWGSTPVWAPTVSGGLATASYTPATSTTTGVIQMRAQATLGTAPTLATNANGEYQAKPASTTQTWTTLGEIEDYTFQVAPAVWRPAVVAPVPYTGTVTVTPGANTTSAQPQTFTNPTADPQMGSGVGVVGGSNASLTIAVPSGYTLDAKVVDSESGADMGYTPTFSSYTGNATVTWGPMAVNDDVTVVLTLKQPPKPGLSTMTCTPTTSATKGPDTDDPIANGDDTSDYYSCTALVQGDGPTPLAGETVQFSKDAGSPLTLSSDTCTTGSDGKCTVQVKVTSKVKDSWKLHASVDTTGAGNWEEVSNSPTDLMFQAGPPDNPICVIDDGGTSVSVQGGQVYPYPFKFTTSTLTPPMPDTFAPTGTDTLDTTATQQVRTYLFDKNCNRVTGYTVTFTGSGTTATVSTTQATTDSDGKALGTVKDTKAETVTVGGSYASGGTDPITGDLTAAAVTFSHGVVDGADCVVTVGGVQYTVTTKQVYPEPFVADPASTATPKKPLTTATAKAGDVVPVRTYLFDDQCNPIGGYTVDFAGTPAMQPDGTTPTATTTQGTTDSDGLATGSVTDKKAQTVSAKGTYASPAGTSPTDSGDLLPGSVTFTAGDPATCTTAGACVCADSADTMTNLSVASTTAQIPSSGPGKVLATAHVTDKYCNVVADGTSVNFSVTPAGTGSPNVGSGTAVGTTSTVSVTTTNGAATATVSDTTAENVDVAAAITAGAINGSPQTVQFLTGDFSDKSTLTCTPTSSSTDMPITPVATDDQTKDYWTCVVHAMDNNDNPLLNEDVTKFQFTQTTNTAKQTTPVVNSGGGDYTVKFYSDKADGTNAVTATYNAVTTTGSPALIPFKADKGCDPTKETCPVCHVNGRDYVASQVYADPNTTSVEGTSALTVLIADPKCNGIEGATVTFDKGTGNNAVISTTTNPAKTNTDGLATSSVTDVTAETVTIGGSFDATNAKSAGISGNYGSGSLSSDTTSLGGTTGATGVSMVEFTAGDVCTDPATCSCTVKVMPENIDVTITPGQVYSGTAPWKADGTAQNGSSSVTANGTATVALRTWLLDKDCNPVPGAKATFTGNPATPSVITPATAITTDSTGMAAATIKDTKTETVTVDGTYTPTKHTATDTGNLSSTTATFTEGAIDPAKSVFVVTPAVDPTSASKTNWVVADGTTPYSGYVAAYDAAGNPVTTLSAT
ncbi:MAG: hypothetical protein FWD63_06360, partial [Propionibacteriaceae bacterium]|nr:hypothetical protein [Propionibacteriaceae bacterium]